MIPGRAVRVTGPAVGEREEGPASKSPHTGLEEKAPPVTIWP